MMFTQGKPLSRNKTRLWQQGLIIAAMGLTLTACGTPVDEIQPAFRSLVSLDLPDSMTGGKGNATSAPVAVQMSATARNTVIATTASQPNSDQPCAYQGAGSDDPFSNGYNMTRFMVGAAAAWTCVADFFIQIADYVPHDGVIHATDNDTNSGNYEADEPTHYRVSDEGGGKVAVKLYYGYDRANPPTNADDPAFFASWIEGENDTVNGRLIMAAVDIPGTGRQLEDPTHMRLDFNYTESQKTANMYIAFDANNDWAHGFRIEVVQDLNVNPLTQVYLARGLMDMKRQWLETPGVSELPVFQMYTVSDQLGEGAAKADFVNVGVPLELNAATSNHLGNYVFSKLDSYFFEADSDWDWIEKSIYDSAYRGGRTTQPTGGTWDAPFSPSLDQIIAALMLDADYFTGSKCAVEGDNCDAFMNALFRDGFAGQEPNQGSDPMDWRSAAVATPIYLNSVYPNGMNWDGAFDPVF